MQETRDADFDGLPQDLSPLLDDSTIGVKTAALKARKQALAASGSTAVGSSSTCFRLSVMLNLGLSAALLGFICWFAVEIAPATEGDDKARPNITLTLPSLPPNITLTMPTLPKIKWDKLGLSTKVPPLYDPSLYPWAEDTLSFIDTLEKGQAAVAAARQALWDARLPNSEIMFPHVGIWNEEHLTKKFNKAVLTQGAFTIGVMGTSVTAGHDNFFNQSFPVVWGKLMEEAFTAAGVELVMRNHAMGWNPIHPSYFCVGEMTGMDTDITMWEYGMMGGGDGDLEQWIRSSILLPNQPHMLICDPGEGPRNPGPDEVLQPREGNPNDLQPWKMTAMDWYIDDGFSMASNQLLQSFMFLDHLPEYQYGELFCRDKPTDRPAGWHPGPHGHHFRAEILAWNYLGFFEKSLAEVREHLVSKNPDLTPLLPTQLPVPEPTQCQAELCTDLATCVTSFEPRQGPGLIEHVVFPEEVPFITDSQQAGSNAVTTWHEQLYFCDVAAVDHMLEKEWNYLDRKNVIQAAKGAGPIRYEFESTKQNYFVACSAPGNPYLCMEGTHWKMDGEPINCVGGGADGIPGVQQPCWITDRKIPAGKHTFEVERPDDGVPDGTSCRGCVLCCGRRGVLPPWSLVCFSKSHPCLILSFSPTTQGTTHSFPCRTSFTGKSTTLGSSKAHGDMLLLAQVGEGEGGTGG